MAKHICLMMFVVDDEDYADVNTEEEVGDLMIAMVNHCADFPERIRHVHLEATEETKTIDDLVMHASSGGGCFEMRLEN